MKMRMKHIERTYRLTWLVTFFPSKLCAARKKKSLTGLDSIQTDGVCAFTTLVETAEILCSLGEENFKQTSCAKVM